MVDELRVMVIGCGNMGTKRVKALTEVHGARAVFLVDMDPTCAERLAKEYGVEYGKDLYAEIGRVKPDIVIVSLPNKFHAPITQAALEKDVHVLCEKPLARTPQEAKGMVETAARSKSFLKTGSNLRFFPNVTKAGELLAKGEVGDILFFRGWIGNSGWHLQRSWRSWFADYELAGGGTVLDNGVHMFDLVRLFLGEVNECFGVSSTLLHGVAPLEDLGLSVFKTVDGKLAYVQSSWVDWAGYMYMEIYGADGYVRVDSRENACVTILGKKDGSKHVFDYSDQPPVSYRLELQYFVDCIRAGKQPYPSGFDGLRAVQMAHGIYESSRTGRRVRLYGPDEERLKALYKSCSSC